MNREIVNTRIFDALRESVFAAFSEPQRLAQWWGPKGFSNTFQEFDLRPGGVWRFIMHGPGGEDFRNESVFLEVVEPAHIVFKHLLPMHEFRMSMTFEDVEGKTRLTWRMLFDSAEEFEMIKDFILQANEQNFDRLESHLTQD